MALSKLNFSEEFLNSQATFEDRHRPQLNTFKKNHIKKESELIRLLFSYGVTIENIIDKIIELGHINSFHFAPNIIRYKSFSYRNVAILSSVDRLGTTVLIRLLKNKNKHFHNVAQLLLMTNYNLHLDYYDKHNKNAFLQCVFIQNTTLIKLILEKYKPDKTVIKETINYILEKSTPEFCAVIFQYEYFMNFDYIMDLYLLKLYYSIDDIDKFELNLAAVPEFYNDIVTKAYKHIFKEKNYNYRMKPNYSEYTTFYSGCLTTTILNLHHDRFHFINIPKTYKLWGSYDRTIISNNGVYFFALHYIIRKKLKFISRKINEFVIILGNLPYYMVLQILTRVTKYDFLPTTKANQ